MQYHHCDASYHALLYELGGEEPGNEERNVGYFTASILQTLAPLRPFSS